MIIPPLPDSLLVEGCHDLEGFPGGIFVAVVNHGVHEGLEGGIELVVPVLCVRVLDVLHNVGEQELPQHLVLTPKELEEEFQDSVAGERKVSPRGTLKMYRSTGQVLCGGDHILVPKQDEALHKRPPHNGHHDIVVLLQQLMQLVWVITHLRLVANRNLEERHTQKRNKCEPLQVVKRIQQVAAAAAAVQYFKRERVMAVESKRGEIVHD